MSAPVSTKVAPSLFADLAKKAPARLVRKLDKNPQIARSWSWEEGAEGKTTVATDRGETVTLRPISGVLSAAEQVSCTCLLTPRCLHVLAVVTSLDVAEPSGPIAAQKAPPTESEPTEVELTDGQRKAAQAAWIAATAVVESGALGAGALTQAELLRAAHSCRGAGLYRLSSAGVRVFRSIRELKERSAAFSLSRLSSDLSEMLECSYILSNDGQRRGQPLPHSLIGTARRRYEEAGSLHLFGLLSEPVVAAGGYAGVVTYLCDSDGRVFTTADVKPGPPSRASTAYSAPVSVGDVCSPHRDLCRQVLYLQHAKTSHDGRLSAGAKVKAVRGGSSSWSDQGPSALFDAPLADQMERVARAVALPPAERRAGADLLFLTGEVVGASRAGVVLAVRSGQAQKPLITLRAPSDHSFLEFNRNLERLGRLRGLPVRVAGRVQMDRPRWLTALALAPGLSDERSTPSLRLPTHWEGRVNMGLDPLQGAHIEGAGAQHPGIEPADGSEPNPLELLRRRLDRMAIGGRATLPPEAREALEAEAARLRHAMMPSAAQLLRTLAESANKAGRDISGARKRGASHDLAVVWLTACMYERVARHELFVAAWQ